MTDHGLAPTAGTASLASQAPHDRMERALEIRKAMAKHREGKPLAFPEWRRP